MLQAIEKKLQDAKVEHADARPIGAELDSAIAMAAKKNAELEKQREQVERAQEKLNRLQAEAMEADKKVTTLRAEAFTAARTQEGQKLSPRDYFEKIAKGVAAVKESLKEGEKEVLSPIELELSEVIKTIRGRERGCANGQCGPKHPNGVLGGRGKALDKRGKHATKRSSLPRSSGQQEETQQLNNFENATPAEQMMEWRRTKLHPKRSWEPHKKGKAKSTRPQCMMVESEGVGETHTDPNGEMTKLTNVAESETAVHDKTKVFIRRRGEDPI